MCQLGSSSILKMILVFLCFIFVNFSAIAKPLKILSLNFNAESNNLRLKKKRLKLFENYIKTQDLDVVMVQECWQVNGLSNLAIQVARDLDYDLAYNFEDGVMGVRVTSTSILAKKKYHLRDIKIFKLPHSAPTIGDGQKTWVALGAVNILIGGKINIDREHEAYFWTTHLASQKAADRLDQVTFALSKIKQSTNASWESANVFFAGDMNAESESPEMSAIRGQGFEDVWSQTHHDDLGITFTDDLMDPEYNPMVHAAGQFPAQDTFGQAARIDYIFAHVPAVHSLTSVRVFTAPIENVWMSDHFGIYAAIDWSKTPEESGPSSSSDSVPSSMGPPTQLILTEKSFGQMWGRRDFEVTSARGFSIQNLSHVRAKLSFTGHREQIYNSPDAFLEQNNVDSFSFFRRGDYPYRLSIVDEAAHGDPSVYQEMYGIIHVK
jgi:endonuclease/exonuclease/phosphatase family metal-dependent hydrolase